VTEIKPRTEFKFDRRMMTLEEVVYQAVGAASMAWAERDLLEAGVFDTEWAGQVAKELLHFIQDYVALTSHHNKSLALDFLQRTIDDQIRGARHTTYALEPRPNEDPLTASAKEFSRG
jgi:hypothetical protein